jgi:chromosomal replication initiator protein
VLPGDCPLIGHRDDGRDQSNQKNEGGSPAILEESLRLAVSQRVGATKFALWFGGNVRLGLNREGDRLIVRVPDPFFRNWIERHYAPALADAVEAVVGRRLGLSVEIDSPGPGGPPDPEVTETPPVNGITSPSPEESQLLLLPTTTTASRSDPPSSSGHLDQVARIGQTTTTSPDSRLILPEPSARPQRRLEDYVPGPGNRVAHAAATEMARTAGRAFNPLLIHGGIGLGKSHLLEGINQGLKQFHPKLQILQLTAEAFTNGFLDSMRSGTLNGFRARFRSAGGLIVDDIQFLAAKRATMVEFLYTFNALYDKGAPIILSADQHPRQISRLSDELVTRFVAGMVARIEPPDVLTRQAILKAKASARGVDVPEAVLAYIAEHLRASIRELEGALCTVIAQAALTSKRIDLSLAQSALRDSIRHTTLSIGLRDVERVVCNLFQVKAEALRSDSRTYALAYPRLIAMYMSRKHIGAAYSEIGRHYGGRTHATVIAAERKVEKWLRSEKRVALLPGFETVADLLYNLERALGTMS